MKSHIPIRDAIIDGLQMIDGAEDARRCLGYFLRVCNTMMKQVISDETVPEKANLKPVDLSRFRVAIDPAWGTGYFWYYAIDDCMAVSVYDVTFSRATGFDTLTDTCLGLGSYGRGIIPYFQIEGEPADRTLLGYAWPRQRYAVQIPAGTHIDVTSIVMLEEGTKRMAARLGHHPATLARALAALDGTRAAPDIVHALDVLREARPGARMAGAYYEAKALEALCLALDLLDSSEAPTPTLSADDRAAIGAARQLIAANLDRTVPVEEICRAALVSASRLNRLFREIEGCTPQAWARSLRLERACTLLRETNLSVGEIARRLGFARQGSLSEAFRAQFACTPSAYRAEHR